MTRHFAALVKRGAACALVALLASAASAGAQVSGVAFGVGGYAVQPRLVLQQGDLREILTGTWVGGAARTRLGMFALHASAAVGKLTASSSSPPTLARDGVEASAEVDLWLTEGFALTGGVRLRGFATSMGSQTWRIIRTGLRISAPLGSERLRAYLSAGYLPSVRVSGQSSPKLAFDADVGLVAAPLSFPLEFMVGYRLERFDFAAGPTDRAEEFAAAYAGVSLGRLW